ncbi:MAG: hypothetical protein Q4F65_05660 [Propionibacteriaceae bacterium]|nr:hypothetical protein [Propionibacteriaceae bacterium]
MIDVNVNELRELGVWLRESGPEVNRAAPGVVRKAAMNIKGDWQMDAAFSRHFRLTPTINFDERRRGDVIEAEIGPDRRRRAARLAGIAHFGGANGGGGTLGDPTHYLDKEAPRMAEALAKIVDEALS